MRIGLRAGAFGLAFSASLVMFAQTFGEITGEIQDPSGAVAVGATVTATHRATNAVRTTASNAAGVYAFPSLQPGVYNLRVEMQGFRTVTRTDVELQVQQTARIDFTLQVGLVTESIEVSGGGSLLATENATVGTVIENRRIVELPLNGRNFLQLVSLSPNVSFGFNSSFRNGAVVRQGGTRAEQNISIAGQRSMFNRFTLDGVENTDVNFNTYIILPSIDALQEFKVQSGIYPAEFGREAGQINVLTKSGTNQFHGALFEFLRNDKLDAKAYAFTGFRPPKDPFKWNQYGFTLGGPVWVPKVFNGRNRLFFLSDFEGYRDRKQLRGVYNVPSLAMRGGDFSALGPRLYDPATRGGTPLTAQPFAGNVIPKDRLHPTAIRLMEFYAEPNVNTGSLVSNYQVGLPRRIDKDQFIQRIDFVESNSSSWFGRYSWGDEGQTAPADPNTFAARLNGNVIVTRVKQAMLSNTRVLSPALVNEFRFGYNKFFNSVVSEPAFQRDVVAELKIPGVSLLAPIAWGIPTIEITGLSSFGSLQNGPFVGNDHIFQWLDNISWTRGKHSLRFGAEVRRDRYNQMGNLDSRGRFRFQGPATQNPASRAGTGFGFADFLLGFSRQSSTAANLANTQFRATSQYYYIDDSWKVLPNLTISLGLRYENTPPWFDRGGTLINAHVPFVDTTPNVQDPTHHPTLVRIGSGDFYEGTALRFNPAIKVARDGRLGDRLTARDNNDFAPRLGIAWSPTSHWTVRTGFGVFYSQDTGNPRFDMARNLAGRLIENSSTDTDLTWDRPFRGLGGGTTEISRPFVLANIHQRRTPYSLQYLVNLQREWGTNTVLEAGYMGSGSRKLEHLRYFNQALPSTLPLVPARQPYPELDLIQELDGSGKANYNSLALKAQRRFSRGLTYLVGYTWSRSIDTTSAIRVHDGDPQFPQNSLCLRCERGLSSFHTAHRFVTSALYELPFGKGKRYANSGGAWSVLAGGWQLSSIITLQSGFPLTIFSGAERSNTGNNDDRPNATGATVPLPRGQQDPERFFNTTAFVLQPFGTLGNVGRNTVIGPGLINWDFSSLKNIRVREGRDLQFRFEGFNFANHPNWGTPDGTVDRVTFGKVRSTRTNMRELQFGLKYIF